MSCRWRSNDRWCCAGGDGLRRVVFLTSSSVGFSSAPAGGTDGFAAQACKSQGDEAFGRRDLIKKNLGAVISCQASEQSHLTRRSLCAGASIVFSSVYIVNLSSCSLVYTA